MDNQSQSPFCKSNPFTLPPSSYYQPCIPSALFFSSKPISKYSTNRHTISDNVKYQNLIINRMLQQRSKTQSLLGFNIVDKQIDNIQKNTRSYGSHFFDLHDQKVNPFLRPNIFESKLEEVKNKSKKTKKYQQSLLLWKPNFKQPNQQPIWSQNQLSQLYRQLRKSDALKSNHQSELNKQIALDLTRTLDISKKAQMTFNMPGSKIHNNSQNQNLSDLLQPQEIVDAFKQMFLKRKQSVIVHSASQQNFESQSQYISKLLHKQKKQTKKLQKSKIKKQVEEDWEKMMQQYQYNQNQLYQDKFDNRITNQQEGADIEPKILKLQNKRQDNYYQMMQKYEKNTQKPTKGQTNNQETQNHNLWLNMLSHYQRESNQKKFESLDTFRSPQSKWQTDSEKPQLNIWKNQENQKQYSSKESYQSLVKQTPGIPPLKNRGYNKRSASSFAEESPNRKKAILANNQQIINRLLPTVDEQNPWVTSPNDYNLDAWQDDNDFPDSLQLEGKVYKRIN